MLLDCIVFYGMDGKKKTENHTTENIFITMFYVIFNQAFLDQIIFYLTTFWSRP